MVSPDLSGRGGGGGSVWQVDAPSPDAAPRTGDGAVDQAVGALDGIGRLPLRDQVQALDEAHQMLQGRLADSDGGTR
jgi:hypothetical protein